MANLRSHSAPRGGAILLLAVVGVSLAIGLYLGRRTALQEVSTQPPSADSVAAMQEQIKELRGELEVSKARHRVDRQSLEMVRGNMAAHNEQIAALEEDLRFYRSLMAPEHTPGEISINAPVLEPRAQPGEYDYRFIVRQRASKHLAVKGSLAIRVAGLTAGEPAEHPIQALSAEELDEPLPLNFRYFQTLDGTLQLPEGFEPRRIKLVATLVKPKKQVLQEDYSWQIKE